MIEFAQWQELDLRVGKVTAAQSHPKADKLIVLQVDLGAETRQIVAGVKEWYDPAALVGRSVVVVANLQPVTLRGVESRGMLLAATDESGGSRVVSMLTCDRNVAPGSKVS